MVLDQDVYKRQVVLRTFSKAYGLAGLRVGYGIAPEPVCSMLHKARAPFNLHVLAQDCLLYTSSGVAVSFPWREHGPGRPGE